MLRLKSDKSFDHLTVDRAVLVEAWSESLSCRHGGQTERGCWFAHLQIRGLEIACLYNNLLQEIQQIYWQVLIVTGCDPLHHLSSSLFLMWVWNPPPPPPPLSLSHSVSLSSRGLIYPLKTHWHQSQVSWPLRHSLGWSQVIEPPAVLPQPPFHLLKCSDLCHFGFRHHLQPPSQRRDRWSLPCTAARHCWHFTPL